MRKKSTFPILFLIIYCSVEGQDYWTAPDRYTWLTASNWSANAVPTSTDVAQFRANPTADPAYISVTTNTYQDVGAIELTPARPYDISIGNGGSSNPSGKLRIFGATINNISHVILRNNSSRLLTLKDNQGTGSSLLTVTLIDGTTDIINIDGSGGITISSGISGSNINLIRSGTGSGILTLTNGYYSFTGTTTLSQGELRFNPVSANSTFLSQIVLNGGTLSTNSIILSTAITFSSTLKLDANSTIALGTNAHSLKFSASNNITWSGTLLTITGWTGAAGVSGTSGKIYVGLNANGLSANQLTKISFAGFPVGAKILSSGEIVPLADYPPVTYYSRGSFSPVLTSSWNSNRDGSSGTVPPNFNSGIFVIQNSHNMITSASWSISGVASKLQIEAGGTLTANNPVTLSSATTFQIDNGGIYIHNNSGNPTIFSGTENFAPNSSVEIKNWINTSIPIPIITGSWGNLKITYNPGVAWNQAGNITSIAGNFTIDNSSASPFIFTNLGGLTLTINGDFNIITGMINLSDGLIGGSFNLYLGGSYNQTGGTFNPSLSGSSILFFALEGQNKTFTHSAGTLISAQILWVINPGGAYILNDDLNVATNRTLAVNGSLDCGIKAVTGPGSFNLPAGATLLTANPAGINGSISVTGTKIINTAANYFFKGSVSQVTGTLLPAVVNNFTVDNDAGVKLTNTTLTINGALTINPGKLFTIEPGKQLSVTGNTNINSPECLVIKSDATGTGSFIDHGFTGLGTVSIERYLSTDSWHYISSPITNATANVFFGDYLMTSDPSQPSGWGGWITDPATSLEVMRGYACWKPGGNSNSEVFIGNPNTGDKTFIVNNNNGSGTFEGYHLVGNPYTSAIDLSAILDWGAFEHTAYFWNQSENNPDPYTGGGNYDAYPVSGTWGTHSKYAPATQGFYIHNPAGNTSITIPSSARVHNGTNFLKEEEIISNGLLITAESDANHYTDKITVHFDPKATSGFDPGFDAYKLWGLNEAPQLYTLIGDLKVTCNSLPFDKKNMIIPLSFQCGLNSQFILRADSLTTFSENISVYLEDLKTNTIQDLRLNPYYTFNYDTLDNSNRFLLHFEDAAFGIKDSKQKLPVEVYSYRDAIYIRSEETDLREAIIFVYDLTGRLCFNTILSERSIEKIIPGVVDGVYFVHLIKGENSYNVRVLLGKNM